MKKIIKITEQQLTNIVKRTIDEGDVQDYPVFIEHWENKFHRAVEILLKLGRSSDELIEEIKIIENKNNEQI
jgi:hypothetical protein